MERTGTGSVTKAMMLTDPPHLAVNRCKTERPAEASTGLISVCSMRSSSWRRCCSSLCEALAGGRLTIKDCFHTLSAVACGVEGSESVETISWAEPLRGGWGYGD